MTLDTLAYVYMCGIITSFTGASVMTVWGMSITNRLLKNGLICSHQHNSIRVRDMMFFFRCTGWLAVLMTAILSAVVVFYCQMQIPHARAFLLAMWAISACIFLLSNGVLTAFLALDGDASCDGHDGGYDDGDGYDGGDGIPPEESENRPPK